LKSIQIQTLTLFLLLNLFPNLITSLGPDPFSCSLQPAQPAPNRGPSNLTPIPAIYHPPTAWAHVSVNHSPLSSPFFPRLGFAPHRATRVAAARAGWDSLPAGPARTHAKGPARTRAHESNPTMAGFSSFAPAPCAPATWPARRWVVPPRPPGRSNPGQPGAFASTLAAPGFKSKERLRPGCPSHQPLWGFLFLHLQ
jgi:hypothetical protein